MPRLILVGLVAGLFSALFGVGGGIVTRRGGTPGSPTSPLLFALVHDRRRGCAGLSPAPPATPRLFGWRRA